MVNTHPYSLGSKFEQQGVKKNRLNSNLRDSRLIWIEGYLEILGMYEYLMLVECCSL